MNAYHDDLDTTRFERIRRRANTLTYTRRSHSRGSEGIHRRRRHHWRPASKSALAAFSVT